MTHANGLANNAFEQRLLSTGGSSSHCQLATQTDAAKRSWNNLFRFDSVVAVFPTHDAAEDAVRHLQASGVNMKTLSIAARNQGLTEHVNGYYTAGDRMLRWSKIGAICGALWGFVFDTALFAIPGIGPVLLAGPLVSWIMAVVESSALFAGVSALGAALVSIGIPKQNVLQYEFELKAGKYLLIVHGTASEINEATRTVGGTHYSGQIYESTALAH